MSVFNFYIINTKLFCYCRLVKNDDRIVILESYN